MDLDVVVVSYGWAFIWKLVKKNGNLDGSPYGSWYEIATWMGFHMEVV
jgi:hypothetical protein